MIGDALNASLWNPENERLTTGGRIVRSLRRFFKWCSLKRVKYRPQDAPNPAGWDELGLRWEKNKEAKPLPAIPHAQIPGRGACPRGVYLSRPRILLPRRRSCHRGARDGPG
jgi:hypothetical protein